MCSVDLQSLSRPTPLLQSIEKHPLPAMADLNPLFYTSGPLVRLSKEFNLNGLSMVSVMPHIHSFLLPAAFTTPKSSGAPVKEALAEYQRLMALLQVARGYTDQEMRRRFYGSKDVLWNNIDKNGGFRKYLDCCFDFMEVMDPPLSVFMGHDFEPMPNELRVHRTLGHRYVLMDDGEIMEGVGVDGTSLPDPYVIRVSDAAIGFNDDVGTGFVRQ